MYLCPLIVENKNRSEGISGILGNISIVNMDLDNYGFYFSSFESCFGYK